MIKKRYITLGLIGILLYGLFFYEPSVDETDIQTFLSIKSGNENQDVSINLTNVASINVANKTGANIKVGNDIRLRSDDMGVKANVLGVGHEMEDVESYQKESDSGAEVSISNANPMAFSAGNVMVTDDAIHIDGTGIGKAYALDGQDLFVNGVKNHVKVDGQCKHVYINGVAMMVRIENAISVEVNGVGNRVYLSHDLPKNKKSTDGVLNFIFTK